MKAILKKYLRNGKIAFLVVSIVIISSFQVIYIKRYCCQFSENIDTAYNDPIDLVYTWVNGSDEKFLKSLREYTNEYEPARYENRDELKYSIRSLEKFAPWVRHVYIVTNGQIPSWLNLEYEKVSVVPHNQLAQEPEILPTFSSNAIEQFIHRIPNLSKRFLYLNDDIFLGSELYLEDLYTPSDGFKIVTTDRAPACASSCSWSILNDGMCDKGCNVPECEFDGNDCVNENNIIWYQQETVSNLFKLAIIYNSKMFNLAYGLKKRNILPHMGFLFDKDIIEEMLGKFQNEFNSTRYNKFRTVNDMQIGYSFAHYVMSETRIVSVEEIFDSFDLDKSEIWSDKEINLLLNYLDLEPLNKTRKEYFEELILNCFMDNGDFLDSEDMANTLYETPNIEVSKDLVIKCSSLSETLVKGFPKQSKYQFQYTNMSKTISRYILLSSNITEAKLKVNEIQENPRKFNCIGDFSGIENNNKENKLIIKEILENAYTTLFPDRSKFELPELVINPFRYYDDYVNWKRSQQLKSIFCNILSVILIFFLLTFCLKLKIYRKLNYN